MKLYDVKTPDGQLMDGLSGPDVVALAKSGRLTVDSIIRQQGQERWHSVKAVPQIAVHLRAGAAEVRDRGTRASMVSAPQRRFLSRRLWVFAGTATVVTIGALVALIALPAFDGRLTAEEQFELGQRYEEGDGVPKDLVEAARWYRKAADRGHSFAQMSLANAYGNGDGVPEDPVEAAKWWRKGADRADPVTQFLVALRFAQGLGVPKDQVEMVRWLRKSAEQGHVDAQYYLGVSYGKGEGVEKSESESMKWLRKAAEQGHEKATLIVRMFDQR